MNKKIIRILLVALSVTMFIGCSDKNVKDNNESTAITNQTGNNKEDENKTEISNIEDKNKEEKDNSNNSEEILSEEKDEVENEQPKLEKEVVVQQANNEEASQEAASNNIVESNIDEVVKNYRLYFYDVISDCIYYEDRDLTVVNKAVVKALTEGLKYVNGNYLTIPAGTSVRSASLDSQNGILTVDLSGDYYNSNLGSGPEHKMLQTLALTYGYNYGVDKVIILIDGNLYSTGHNAYYEGQYVDTSSAYVVPMP